MYEIEIINTINKFILLVDIQSILVGLNQTSFICIRSAKCLHYYCEIITFRRFRGFKNVFRIDKIIINFIIKCYSYNMT